MNEPLILHKILGSTRLRVFPASLRVDQANPITGTCSRHIMKPEAFKPYLRLKDTTPEDFNRTVAKIGRQNKAKIKQNYDPYW